jgi:xylulose-5-phosphate/fructose-6-phosphate phosphoketolase
MVLPRWSPRPTPKVPILNFIRAFRETLTACESVVVLNKMSRYHLCIEAVGRSLRMQLHARKVIEWCDDTLESHRKYVVRHLEDMLEISQS